MHVRIYLYIYIYVPIYIYLRAYVRIHRIYACVSVYVASCVRTQLSRWQARWLACVEGKRAHGKLHPTFGTKPWARFGDGRLRGRFGGAQYALIATRAAPRSRTHAVTKNNSLTTCPRTGPTGPTCPRTVPIGEEPKPNAQASLAPPQRQPPTRPLGTALTSASARGDTGTRST